MYRLRIHVMAVFVCYLCFPQLAMANQSPPPFVERLKSEGCVIPDPFKSVTWPYTPNYTISGEFAHIGQKDLAVLCSKGGKLYIRIEWGGKYQCPSTIDATFGDSIEVVGRSYILDHYELYGGKVPPNVKHQGINDIILGKASVVRYCYEGKWMELTGAD